MIDHEILVTSATTSAAEVFSMMLEMEVEYTGSVSDLRASESGLISLVGITGDWGGSGIFCCPPPLAALIFSRMLGVELNHNKGIDEEVLDAVAEITNMLIGNVKNALEDIVGPLAISVPTVIHGKNFQFRNAAGLQGVALGFMAEGHPFEIRIALAPVSEKSGFRAKVPILGLAHM